MAIQMPKRPHDTLLPGMGGLTLADFWSWAYSDVLSNGNRSVFAEFLVASALGVTATPRREWDMVDLRYNGKKIEVKASAYAQSWVPAGQPTSIRFDIALRRPWDAETNTLGATLTRSADVYVFCLYPEQDRQRAVEGILDANAWRFYVLATDALNRRLGDQKSVGLATVAAMCAEGPVGYAGLRERIDVCLTDSA